MEPREANPVEGLTLTLSPEAARLEAHRRLRRYLGNVAIVALIFRGSKSAWQTTTDWQGFLTTAALWGAILVGVPLLLWFFRARPYYRDLQVRMDETSLSVGVPGEMSRVILSEIWLVRESADGLALSGGQWSDVRIPWRLNQFEALRTALRERVPQVEWSDFSQRSDVVRTAVGYLILMAFLMWDGVSVRRGVTGVLLLVGLLAWVWTRPGTGMAVRLGATAAISTGICVVATMSVVGLARLVEIFRT